VNIDPQVVDPDDVETLQDLVIGAFQAANDNLQQLSQEKMGPLSQGLGGFGL
jgi:DNA-binding protein YbaB